IDKDFGVDLHPPVYHLLLGGWTTALGASVFASRLLSAFAGVLTVPLVAVYTRAIAMRRQDRAEKSGQRSLLTASAAGLVAGALATLSPIDVFYSQESRMYPLLPVIGAVSLIATLRLLQTSNRRNWSIWVASNVVGLYVFYYLGLLTAAESL